MWTNLRHKHPPLKNQYLSPSVAGHLKGGDAIEAQVDLLQLRDSWCNMHHLTRRKKQSRFRRLTHTYTQTPDSTHAATNP